MTSSVAVRAGGHDRRPDIRLATSLIDYIFRRPAVDYLPLEERMDLGILVVGERLNPTLPGIEEAATQSSVRPDDALGQLPRQPLVWEHQRLFVSSR